MENAAKSGLQAVRLGEPQTYKNIAIVPLIAPAVGTFQYHTLGEVLTTGDVVITETSADGCVPELMVVSRSTKPVLLINGEELAGTKQNRVLNTHILLKKGLRNQNPGQLCGARQIALRLQSVQRIWQRHELQDPVYEDPVRQLLPCGVRRLSTPPSFA
jgi:hypothetical protein